MERGIPMKYRHTIATLLMLLLSTPSLAANDNNRHLVLVTDTATGITALSTSEIHKLFLGLPLEKAGHPLEAAINHSDPFLYEIFLQKIVYMSSISYDRHLLSNVIQLGGRRPRIFNNTQSLINALKQKPGTVSVLWEDDIQTTSDLTIIGEIWHGTIE
jgi:type IV secretory pathway TrbD component